MKEFTYYTPTKVVFGVGTEAQVGALVREQNCKKVLIHYGGGSVKRTGLLDRIKASLDEAGVAYVELGGVVPNPHLDKAREGIALCKQEGVDFLLAVGGGSVIDSAKCIGYGVANEGDVWDFYEGKRTPKACLPLGAVLTISAAGSEMSNSSVITNTDGGWKRDCSCDLSRPVFAVMNPELTMTLPAYQTASGCVDIMMHTMERYFNSVPENMDLTDGISEALMRTVMDNARILAKEPNNLKARSEIMWAGSLAHNDLTGCGGEGDWCTHRLEHEMGGMFDVTHGAGLAAIWASWARRVWTYAPKRFVQFATRVMGVEPGATDAETVEKGIQALEQFYRDLHMPTSMAELGISPTPEQIHRMAEKCLPGGSVKSLTLEDRIAIYTAALGK